MESDFMKLLQIGADFQKNKKCVSLKERKESVWDKLQLLGIEHFGSYQEVTLAWETNLGNKGFQTKQDLV